MAHFCLGTHNNGVLCNLIKMSLRECFFKLKSMIFVAKDVCQRHRPRRENSSVHTVSDLHSLFHGVRTLGHKPKINILTSSCEEFEFCWHLIPHILRNRFIQQQKTDSRLLIVGLCRNCLFPCSRLDRSQMMWLIVYAQRTPSRRIPSQVLCSSL